ncbi:hypothetical protein PVAG01_08051 [Phlyctema vagabunda]|uniref:Uncharacterized protein n=1 Tax=Phlyctema vagabunda TaxID=108571 RepID=A0ABR4P8B7_9HELO
MKSTLILAAFVSLMMGVVSANPVALEGRAPQAPGQGDTQADCDDEFDCCYTSTAACFRQLGYGPGNIYCNLHKYCATDYNIPRTKCNADCCSISTGLGRGCPGK